MRKKHFYLLICSCLFGCHIHKKLKEHAFIFPVKEHNNTYFFDNQETDLAYVFECYSFYRKDNILHFKAIVYEDIVRTSRTADTLKRGVANVKVLLLEYTKTTLLKVNRELPKTNCYGGFSFSYDERVTSNFCLAFVKDSAFNVAYDLKYLTRRFPLKAQAENMYAIDTICQ